MLYYYTRQFELLSLESILYSDSISIVANIGFWPYDQPMKIDIPLLIISLCLALTILLFVINIFPYPFGIIILVIMLIDRAWSVSSR